MTFLKLGVLLALLRLVTPADLQVGVYGPMTSISREFLAVATMLNIDVQKSWDSSYVNNYGAQIIQGFTPHAGLTGVQMQIATSDSNPPVGIASCIEMFQGGAGRTAIDALVGGYHSAISMPIATLSAYYQVPQVSFASTNPGLSDKTNYPFFARTIPSDAVQGKAMHYFKVGMNIPNIAFFYAQEPYGEGLYSVMTSFSSTGVGNYGVTYMPSGYDSDVARVKIQAMKATKQYKVIIVAMTSDQAGPFLTVASQESLCTDKYQLMGSEAVPSFRVTNAGCSAGGGGYMYFTPDSRGPLFSAFEAQWTNMTLAKVESFETALGMDLFKVNWKTGGNAAALTDNSFADTSSLQMEAPFLFDAGWAIVMAANNLYTAGMTINGTNLRDAIRDVTFEGISGNVAFNEFGDRVAEYYVLNSQSGTDVKAFLFSESDNSITNLTSTIVWQNGGSDTTTAPQSLFACLPGLQRTDPATSTCVDCAAGYVRSSTSDSSCEQCPWGTSAVDAEDGMSRTCEIDPVVLGMYGPLTSVSADFAGVAVAFDLDFRKNFDSSLVDRFGPPIVSINSLHSKLRVKLQIANSNSNPETGVGECLAMYQGKKGRTPIVGLIGGYHSAISMPVSALAAQFKVPQVAYGSTSPKLSDKASYPYFLRTIPPDSIQGSAMWGWIKSFYIPTVSFMYQMESYGEGLYQAVSGIAGVADEAYRVTGIGINYMPTNYDVSHATGRIDLLKSSKSRIVILVLTSDQAGQFFPIAQTAGLFSRGWQIFGSEAIPGQFFPESPEGYMWYSPQSQGPLFSQFEAMWRNMTVEDAYSNESQKYYGMDVMPVTWSGSTSVTSPPTDTASVFAAGTTNMPLETPFLFDAGYAFVLAANAMLNAGSAPKDIKGEDFLTAVKAVNFEGITGRVVFNSVGDRLASYFLDNMQNASSGSGLERARVGIFDAATNVITMFAASNTGPELVWQSGDASNVRVPNSLVACAVGQYADPSTLLCSDCPEGLVANSAKDGCEQCPGGMMAVDNEVLGRICEYYPLQLGVYGPFTSVSAEFAAMAVAFDIDFRKNTEPDLVSRFGPPIVSVPGLRTELRIKLQLGTSNSNPDIGIATNLEFFQGQGGRDPIVGLVGGYHSAISMPVASLATQYKIPQLSFASTSPKLSNKETYPWFSRTCPPDSLQGAAMWAVMRSFDIPSATFVYAQESYGEGLFQTISDQAATAGEGFRIQGVGIKYMPSNYDKTLANTVVRQVMGMASKVFFVAMTADQGRPFYGEAIAEGLLSTSYQVFASEALPVTVLETNGIAGYMWFAPTSRGPLWQSFNNLWSKMMVDDVSGASATKSYGLDLMKVAFGAGAAAAPDQTMFNELPAQLESPFLFDALYTFVFAANNMMNQGVSVQDIKGQDLLNAVRNVDFTGVSGRVKLDANGDRLAAFIVKSAQPTRRLSSDGGRELASLSEVSVMSWNPADLVPISYTPGTSVLWMSGSTSPTVAADLTACKPGMQKDSDGICQKCQAGYISPGGNAMCTKCLAGTRSNVPTGATSCIECAPGSMAPSDASFECTVCPAGTYAATNASVECAKCDQGWFQEQEGATACRKCQVNMNTEVLGADSEDLCKCNEGLFRDSRFNPRQPCSMCLEGMTCPFGSDMKNYWMWNSQGRMGEHGPFPLLHDSHMALGDDPLSVFFCNIAKKCPGGAPGTCGKNVDSSVRSCAHCMPEHFWNGDGCEKCNDIEVGGFVFPIVPLLLAPVVISWLYYVSRDESERWGTWRNGLAAFAFLVLNHYQISVLINNANLQYSGNVISYLDGLTFAEDPSAIFRPQCAGLQSFSSDMAVKATSPLFIGALVFLTFLGSWAVKYATKKPVGFDRDRTLNIYFSLMFTFFAGISAMALAAFKCSDNPNGLSTLSKDQSVICGESEWGGMVGLAVMSVILYIIGFGAIFIIAVIRAPALFGNPVFRRRWKFLFIKFRPDVYWFAIAICLKGILMNLGYTFLRLGLAQLYWVIFIVIMYSALVVVNRPWRHRLANALDIYECQALLFVCSLLAFYVHGAESDLSETENAIAVTVMLINLSPLLVAAGLIGKMIYDHKHPTSAQGRAVELKKLTPALILFANSPEGELIDFMEKVDEWGRYYIFNAMHVISTEFMGDAYQKRLSDGKLKSSSQFNSKDNIPGQATLVYM